MRIGSLITAASIVRASCLQRATKLEPRGKVARTMSAMVSQTLGTHSGTFQADEAMGVWLLRRLERFASLPLTRTRDASVLAGLGIVIDVGGTYDDGAMRYDHHQRGFFETFDGAVGVADGPETATGRFKTKLSAAGLVYKHYGREILKTLKPDALADAAALEWVYVKVYEDFMEALDGIDNGIEIADETRYKDGSTLPARVHRLNKRWNAGAGGPSEDERFEKASALCGADFSDVLDDVVESMLPARALVERALKNREAVHASGAVVAFESGGCPWKTHLYDLERELGAGPVQFVLYEDSAKMWRVQAVTVEGTAFTNRLGLLEPWRGLRDAELERASGSPGAKFVHASGFIGGHATYDGALGLALSTLAAAGAI